MYLDLLDTGDDSATTSHSRLPTQFPYETCRIHVDSSLHGRHDRGLARTDAREMSRHR